MRMLPHVRVKKFPSSESDVDNFVYLIRQDWKLIRELLLRLKYVKKYKNDIRLNALKFEEL